MRAIGSILTLALSIQAVEQFRFTPLQPEVLTASGTLVNAFADYDSDGDPDLFVGFNGAPNRLYRNNQGTFADVAKEAGIADARPTRGAAWGDADADGDPDLLVGFAPGAGSVLRLYTNTKGRFADITERAGLVVSAGAVRQVSWINLDGDSDLDLFVAFRDRANAFFQNDRGRFTDVAPALGLADARRSVGAVWFDYDEDGDLDLYVANMDGDANGLYRNDRGTFTDVAEAAGLQWGGRRPKDPANGTVRPCAADVNNDGHFDLFMANYGPNGLFLNRGSGRFEDVSAAWGLAIDGRYDTCAFSSIGGLQALYVNGTVTGGVSYRDYLFVNKGHRFDDVTPDALRNLDADHGAQWADVDMDGTEELALTGAGATPMPLLLRSDERPTGWLPLRVRGVNRRGRATLAGAEVRVYRAGTNVLFGARLVDTGSGYNAQNDLPVVVNVPITDGRTETARVDIETIVPSGGTRLAAWQRNVEVGRLTRPVVTRPPRGR